MTNKLGKSLVTLSVGILLWGHPVYAADSGLGIGSIFGGNGGGSGAALVIGNGMCTGTITADCYDHTGTRIVDPSNCLRDGVKYDPTGYEPPSGNDPRGQSCPVACPPPTHNNGSGSGANQGPDGKTESHG